MPAAIVNNRKLSTIVTRSLVLDIAWIFLISAPESYNSHKYFSTKTPQANGIFLLKQIFARNYRLRKFLYHINLITREIYLELREYPSRRTWNQTLTNSKITQEKWNHRKNETKSSLASNSNRCENVPKCYQLAKGTCIALEAQIYVNGSNLAYKLCIFVKCIYLSLFLFFYIERLTQVSWRQFKIVW